MKTILMMKIYSAIAIAILGVRVAFEFLELIELVQFFGTAIAIGLVATGLHKFFEHKAHTTGKNAANSPNFLVTMVVMTILVSGGIYMVVSYFSSGELSIGFEILFYTLFIPAVVLIAIWMYFKIQEIEYNHRLEEIKNK